MCPPEYHLSLDLRSSLLIPSLEPLVYNAPPSVLNKRLGTNLPRIWGQRPRGWPRLKKKFKKIKQQREKGRC